MLGFLFSAEKVRTHHRCPAEMESNSRRTVLIPVNILLCLPIQAHPRKFPSIFWVRFGVGCQPAGSLSKAGARDLSGAICSWSLARPWCLHSSPCLAESVSRVEELLLPLVLLVVFHTPTAFSIFECGLEPGCPGCFLPTLAF